MLSALVATVALAAPADGLAQAITPFKKPERPASMSDWRGMQDYMRRVKAYERRMEALGLWRDKDEE